MENPPKFEQVEGELNKYIYRDNSDGGVVVFECVASGILEADKKYQEKTGENPSKQNHVGCTIVDVESDLETE